MLPSFLITFREVIEASLIVATILGILTKLGHTKSIRTVWLATGSAVAVSLIILGIGSVLGIRAQELYVGRNEPAIEGIFMILSALFITWAVFFLHTYFAHKKVALLKKVKDTLDREEQEGIFMLVFTAVFREGFEIVLFLSTIFLSSSPVKIFSGIGLGLVSGLLVSLSLFSATLKLPVFYAFRLTSGLLILFAAGLIARGLGEFMQAGAFIFLSRLPQLSLSFVPSDKTFSGHMIETVFGITSSMHTMQLALYMFYIAAMGWWVFYRKHPAGK